MKRYAVPLGRCDYCRKLCFQSRRLAKEYLISSFGKGHKMSVYRCEGADYYHYGHTPTAVKQGVKTRGAISYERRKTG